MTELIRQRTSWDCVLCSVAMATGSTYEEVNGYRIDVLMIATSEEETEGNYLYDFYPFMLEKGYSIGANLRYDKPVKFKEGEETLLKGSIKTPAFITIPSKRFKDGLHQVFYNGREVFDPSHYNEPHPKLEDLEVLEFLALNYHMGRMKQIVSSYIENKILSSKS